MTSSENPAQLCEHQTLVFPLLALPTGENPASLPLPWHFISLALFIQGRLIDRILAHFWWILVLRPASGTRRKQSRRQWDGDGEQQLRRPCFDGYKASSCSGGGGRVRSSGRVAASTGKQQQQRSPSCAGRIAEGQHGRNRKCKQAVMAAKAAVISAEVRWWAGAADKVTKQQQPGSSGSILYRGDYVFCGMSAAAGWAYRHQ